MKINKTLIGIIAAVVIIGGWAASAYNSMVGVQETATTAFAKVQSAYQARADKIQNLVETVKGYATHEKQTLDAVVNARTKATAINLNVEDLTPEKLKEFQQAQGELKNAFGRLIAIQENYPDLKANENFNTLMIQIEGAENRINEARNTYNDAVQKYNVVIRSFPKNILAGMFGFDKMTKFEAEAGAEKAPQVKF